MCFLSFLIRMYRHVKFRSVFGHRSMDAKQATLRFIVVAVVWMRLLIMNVERRVVLGRLLHPRHSNLHLAHPFTHMLHRGKAVSPYRDCYGICTPCDE